MYLVLYAAVHVHAVSSEFLQQVLYCVQVASARGSVLAPLYKFVQLLYYMYSTCTVLCIFYKGELLYSKKKIMYMYIILYITVVSWKCTITVFWL